MKKTHGLPKDWRKQLQEEGRKELAHVYKSLKAESEAIPLRAKTQYPTYIEGRTLHLLRGVALIKRISVQELIRECIEEGLEKRMAKPPPIKRASKKKQSAR